MRPRLLAVVVAAALTGGSSSLLAARAPQAQPREAPPRQAEPRQAQPRTGEDKQRAEPERQRPREPEQAQPRQPAARPDPPRRATPPPRVLPPTYHAAPHRYYFPPVSLHRGYYYHPYFGFYVGPYYGPYYPYPGPYYGPVRYMAGSIRTRIKPVETEVYVNGYYAGLVDDFDGIFQRLYLPAGEHRVEFRLAGFRTFRVMLFLNMNDSRDIVHQMQRLQPGESAESPMPPRTMPEEWTTTDGPPSGDRPSSPFGVLAVRVEPEDAQIFVDGEAWARAPDRSELLLHVPAGPHQLEIRKVGYQTFRTEIELLEGATTKLNVKLIE